MAEGGNLQIVADSLSRARKYSEEKNFGRAFAHYLVVFQLLPQDARQQYEQEFTSVLHFWGSILHNREQYEDIFKCYRLAINYFPNSVEIINNLGIHVLKLQNFHSAKSLFEKCRNIDSNFLPAEQNLQTTKYASVDRWHFPMLNDVIRNKSYAQAIFLEISHGFTDILDIGTGTGILSLFASKSKQCRSIVACDYSETMFEIATQVLGANNSSNIKLINKSSTALSVPDDLKQKATLLITEILDSGVFGENLLETLIHAWDHLLIPYPYGKVIPSAASIFVTGIESDELSRHFRVLRRENNILNINTLCMMHTSDPYDTENLRNANVSYLTESQMALYVNFHDVCRLKMLYEGAKNKTTSTLKCVKNGRIDTFAIWFTLQLNESVTLSTDPKSLNKSCWDQAVQHLRHPLPVQEGQDIPIELSCSKGYLEIKYPEINIHKNNLKCHLVPRNIILFLNDLLLMDYLEDISKILFDRYANSPDFSILDISPFPILGLLLAQQGARLTCCVENISVQNAIREMCEINLIDISRVQIMTQSEFNELTSGDVSWDLVFQNVISSCGILSEAEVLQLGIMKMSLKEKGLYLPLRVNVWAQLVQCDWLDQATKVDDKNCCGFKIAEFINEYKSAEQRQLNFSSIPHTALTEPIEIGYVVDDITSPHIFTNHANAVLAGRANAVFYWFEIHFLQDKKLSTRRDGAFASNAAFMLDPCVNVTVGSSVPLVLKQHKGLMKIYVE